MQNYRSSASFEFDTFHIATVFLTVNQLCLSVTIYSWKNFKTRVQVKKRQNSLKSKNMTFLLAKKFKIFLAQKKNVISKICKVQVQIF